MFEARAINVIRLADYRAGKLTMEQTYRLAAQRLELAAHAEDDRTASALRAQAERYRNKAEEAVDGAFAGLQSTALARP